MAFIGVPHRDGLSRVFDRRGDEGGAAAAIAVLLSAVLMAAAELGVDTAKLADEKGRVQHSADSAWLSGLEGALSGAFNWNSSACHLGHIG